MYPVIPRPFRLYDTYDCRRFSLKMYVAIRIVVDWTGVEPCHVPTTRAGAASVEGRGRIETANPAYAKLAETFKTEPDFYFCGRPRRMPPGLQRYFVAPASRRQQGRSRKSRWKPALLTRSRAEGGVEWRDRSVPHGDYCGLAVR